MWPSFCLFTGRYMWSALSANGSSPGAASSHPSAHRGPSLSHVNGHDGPATLSPAAAASLYSSRVSPLDALYSSPFHTSPTALSFRGLSPGKSHLFFTSTFLPNQIPNYRTHTSTPKDNGSCEWAIFFPSLPRMVAQITRDWSTTASTFPSPPFFTIRVRGSAQSGLLSTPHCASQSICSLFTWIVEYSD